MKQAEAEHRRYWEGRLACSRGQTRAVTDGRMSSSTRAAWYQGWDAEHRRQLHRDPPADAATPEEIESFKSRCRVLLSPHSTHP